MAGPEPSSQPGKPSVRRDKSAAELARRAQRNRRKAWAEGYLSGICTMLRPGDLVVDLGANKGEVTARLAATGAEVVAFEPDPVTFAGLAKRFHGMANVRLIHAAAGVGSGSVRLMRGQNFADNPEGASVKSTILDGGRGIDVDNTVKVSLVDFPGWLRDELRTRSEIAFIKMDIEGAELDILEAMGREGLFAHVRGLVAETHERKFKDLRPRYRALREALAEQQASGRVSLDWI